LSFLLSVAAFIVAIGVLVTIHEYGHYWVARRCGVKVLVFSIGFGKPLFTWQRGETQWQLAAIPLGGFVRMLDEREGDVAAHELDRAFNRKNVWQRMAVVVAGPLANLLLAVLMYWVVFMSGVDVVSPRIGTVMAGSLAAKAGLQVGEVILRLDGQAQNSWQDVRTSLVDLGSARARVDVEVERPGGGKATHTLDLSGLANDQIDGDIAASIGITIAQFRPVLGEVIPGRVAQLAGLQAGDGLSRVDGVPTPDWLSFANAIRVRPGMPTRIEVLRRGQPLTISLTPEAVTANGVSFGVIGVRPAEDRTAFQSLVHSVHYGPVSAFHEAVSQTWSNATLSLKMLGRMLIGQVSVKQLSGPLTMASFAGQSAQIGLQAYLVYLCLISVSLGVLNLLPIPILDGGHLLYYLVELLRGKPLPEWVMELGQRVGGSLLVLLMAVALYNDFARAMG